MEHNKKPVKQFYYSENEWDRLGCGPLPPERNVINHSENQNLNHSFTVDTSLITANKF